MQFWSGTADTDTRGRRLDEMIAALPDPPSL